MASHQLSIRFPFFHYFQGLENAPQLKIVVLMVVRFSVVKLFPITMYLVCLPTPSLETAEWRLPKVAADGLGHVETRSLALRLYALTRH